MMLKPSIDTLLDKVPSKYSLVILEAKRAHELEAGAPATQEFKSVKSTLRALGRKLNPAMLLSIQIQKASASSSPSGQKKSACVKKKKNARLKSKSLKKKKKVRRFKVGDAQSYFFCNDVEESGVRI